MLKWSQCRTLARISLAILCVPICMAGTCPGTTPPPPPPPGNTVLFNGSLATSAGSAIPVALACPPPAGGARGFIQSFNAVAAKLVTITVTGPTATSRPQIRVVDILGNQVANTGPTPTTQTNTTTFTPATSNLFILQVNECANVAIGSVYTVQISQAP
jgi:hypothetical protein